MYYKVNIFDQIANSITSEMLNAYNCMALNYAMVVESKLAIVRHVGFIVKSTATSVNPQAIFSGRPDRFDV